MQYGKLIRFETETPLGGFGIMTHGTDALGSKSHFGGEWAEAKMAGNAIEEQRVLDPCALANIMNDDGTRSVLAPRIAYNYDVRNAARQLLRHQIAGRIVTGGAADRQFAALTSEENLEIEHPPMIDAGVRHA